MVFQKLLHPSGWVLLFLPPLSFAALMFILAVQTARGAPAYLIYCMSAYSLTVWLAVLSDCLPPQPQHRAGTPLLPHDGVAAVSAEYPPQASSSTGLSF